MESDDIIDIDHLRNFLAHEKAFRDTLEGYCYELANAISELEVQKQRGDDKSNEWKTRFEIQQEINEQFRKQTVVLQEKVKETARTSQDFQRSAKANAPPEAFGVVSSATIEALEKEKRSLTAQLLNIELRIDQEAKAYHKANEERKAVVLDVGVINAQLHALKSSTGAEDANSGKQQSKVRSGAVTTKNLPPNQRVLDPKLGPIKKTAAVKQLPPL